MEGRPESRCKLNYCFKWVARWFNLNVTKIKNKLRKLILTIWAWLSQYLSAILKIPKILSPNFNYWHMDIENIKIRVTNRITMTKDSIISSDTFETGSYNNKTVCNVKLKEFKEALHLISLWVLSTKIKCKKLNLTTLTLQHLLNLTKPYNYYTLSHNFHMSNI